MKTAEVPLTQTVIGPSSYPISLTYGSNCRTFHPLDTLYRRNRLAGRNLFFCQRCNTDSEKAFSNPRKRPTRHRDPESPATYYSFHNPHSPDYRCDEPVHRRIEHADALFSGLWLFCCFYRETCLCRIDDAIS